MGLSLREKSKDAALHFHLIYNIVHVTLRRKRGFQSLQGAHKGIIGGCETMEKLEH